MAAEIPALALFLSRWLPRARRQTLHVLTLHGTAIALSVGAAGVARFYSFHL
jgi:hypothetical protein